MRTRRIHYAWIVAAVTFLAMLASAGFRSTVGVFVVPFEDEFGWGRGQVSGAIALNLVFYGLVAPFAAAFAERVGLRKVMIFGLVAVGGGAGLTIAMTSLWQLNLLWGLVIGTATGAISIPLSAIVATRWFSARRGLVTGLLGASFATGNLVFLPLMAWLTGAYGWRWAAGLVAVAAGALIPLILFAMRERPEDVGLLPYGADAPVPPRPKMEGNPFVTPFRVLRDAARVRDFWLLAGTFMVCGWTTNGAVQSHFIPAAHDHGISEVTAASLLAVIGVFDIVGSTASGWLTDRMDPRRLLFMYYCLRGTSLAALPFLLETTNLPLVAFAVIYGLDWVATVPPTIALTHQAFGRERAPIVFGWVFCAHMLGGAAAAWLAGTFREAFGDYIIAFTAAGALGVLAGFASLGIARGGRQPEPQPA